MNFLSLDFSFDFFPLQIFIYLLHYYTIIATLTFQPAIKPLRLCKSFFKGLGNLCFFLNFRSFILLFFQELISWLYPNAKKSHMHFYFKTFLDAKIFKLFFYLWLPFYHIHFIMLCGGLYYGEFYYFKLSGQ